MQEVVEEELPPQVVEDEELPPQLVDEVLVPEIFVPEGSTSDFGSSGYNGVLKAGQAMFEIYLKNRTVDGKPAPLSMCEEHRALITSEALMDNFGVFTTVAVHTVIQSHYSGEICECRSEICGGIFQDEIRR